TGYGRVVRGGSAAPVAPDETPGGVVRAVVEERDADEATRQIREVAVSVYAFAAGPLQRALGPLTTDNAQGEEYLTDVSGLVGAGAVVRRTTADAAVIGAGATVGPYTYLRPGTRLGVGSKAGAFVEMKAANVGDGAKVPHLSYVGDAEIGAGSNIGCGTVFVN